MHTLPIAPENVLDSQILELGGITIWEFSLANRTISFSGKGFLKIFFGIEDEKCVNFDIDEFLNNFVYRNFRDSMKIELMQFKNSSPNFVSIVRIRCCGAKASYPHWVEFFGKRLNGRIVGGIRIVAFDFPIEGCANCKNIEECNERVLCQRII